MVGESEGVGDSVETILVGFGFGPSMHSHLQGISWRYPFMLLLFSDFWLTQRPAMSFSSLMSLSLVWN